MLPILTTFCSVNAAVVTVVVVIVVAAAAVVYAIWFDIAAVQILWMTA